jgi:tripartite-type tricarboxylate transporter receptor subunit TctC
VVIENRPGAATRIAIEAVVKSPADGYTFLVGTPSLATGPSLYASWPYDVKRDLVPVSLVSTTAYALTVNAAVPAQTAGAYIAQLKTNPAQGNVATYGIGTIPHLAAAWFGAASGTELKYIHYNTSPPFADLVAGQTSAIFDALLPVFGNVKAGKLRVLAISGKARHPLLPDVPTFAEAGVAGYDPLVWIGVLAPAGTPRPIVNRVSAAIAQVARLPEVVAQRRDAGSDSVGSSPDEFATFLDAEREKWGAVIRRIALKLE